MSPADAGSLGTRQRLHLGVLVQPYRARGKGVEAVTTGDVAQILEAKYGLFSAFARVYQAQIAAAAVQSFQNAIQGMTRTGRMVDPWGAATQMIQSDFRDFISTYEAERVGIPGTPTRAALMGVNHRLKHPYGRGRPGAPRPNPRRPSFRDTGLLMTSFRAWADAKS
jgi:hypothetical protein